jgi:hypothetical protein
MSIGELETIQKAHPEQVEVGLILGERHRRLGQLAAAAAAFQSVLDRAGGSARLEAGALGGLGLVSQSRDDLTGAEVRFRAALDAAEKAGLDKAANEQREHLAVLARVRGDFLAACDWYGRAGEGGSRAKLTTRMDCSAPRQEVALAASIWRANASPTVEGLAVEARQTRALAAEAEAAVLSGAVKGRDLAPVLGDYSTLVLYTETPEAAEAVARRAIALDPRAGAIKVHLVSPLILEGRNDEADAALRAAVTARSSQDRWNVQSQLKHEFDDLTASGLHRPHMDNVLKRLEAKTSGD